MKETSRTSQDLVWNQQRKESARINYILAEGMVRGQFHKPEIMAAKKLGLATRGTLSFQ